MSRHSRHCWQEDIGIQDARRIERRLDPSKCRELRFAPVEVEPGSLRRSDAVLGADAATEFGDVAHDAIVYGRVVWFEPCHVDVDVAITDVTEEPRRRPGSAALTTSGTWSMKAANMGAGSVTSSLWGAPSVLIASVCPSR